MGKLSVKHSIIINTNNQKAWEIVGPNFLTIGDWARGINKSWLNDSVEETLSGAPAGGRYCEIAGFGTFDERIIHYDDQKFEITWSARSNKLPGFVTGLQNALKVEKIDDSTCRVSSNITAITIGFRGALLGGVMKKQFTKAVHGFMIDWKTYAETGQVSERKGQELAKLAS